MVISRGKSGSRFGVLAVLDKPSLDYPWWRLTVHLGWWWVSVERMLRDDIRGIREREMREQ